ncbi:MAG: hypothetical protein ACXQS8_05615, partial [Candidatus Helarchaeales archaeon]
RVNEPQEFHYLLNKALNFLKNVGVKYFEIFMPVTTPVYQAVAAKLGFIATGYFPGWERRGNERIDHLILTWLSDDHDLNTERAVLTRYGRRIRDAVLEQLQKRNKSLNSS